jgi:hypothetical protein
MTIETYTQEESGNNNINEIEQKLNATSTYVSIGVGGKTVLQFLPQRGITEIEKTYNGQQVRKIRFIVIDPNSGSNAEKFFEIGRRSARLMIAKLKEGKRTLKVERIGSGKDTLYIPTEVAL